MSESELEKQRSAFSNGQLQIKIEEQDFSMRYTLHLSLYPELQTLKCNLVNLNYICTDFSIRYTLHLDSVNAAVLYDIHRI